MVYIASLLYWLITAVCVLGEVQTVLLYATPVESTKKVELGELHYTKSDVSFTPSSLAGLESGDYCIGTKELPNHECFLLAHLDAGVLGGQIDVFVDENIVRLSFFAFGDEIKVNTNQIAKNPTPNLSPANTKAVEKKPELKEGEEEEDNRSFIQKNWMVIVPALLVFMLALPDDKQ